jgi:ATP synthase regulation protein NCA2
MQKLKVHTEAAMLTMDQILASNELTIALSSSIPAFIFTGSLIFLINQSLLPRKHTYKNSLLALRMAFVEVQRALVIVYKNNNLPSYEIEDSSDSDYLESKGLLVYRLFRLNHALHALFSSNYHNWMTYKYAPPASRSVAVSEYVYILRDIAELLSPDSEVNGERKLATAARMIASYNCLAVPPSL